jgi:hypothetical protein
VKKLTERQRPHGWDFIFRKHVALGRDHADAAFRADEYVKRIELQKQLGSKSGGGQS